jgi:hypothetical protein
MRFAGPSLSVEGGKVRPLESFKTGFQFGDTEFYVIVPSATEN